MVLNYGQLNLQSDSLKDLFPEKTEKNVNCFVVMQDGFSHMHWKSVQAP